MRLSEIFTLLNNKITHYTQNNSSLLGTLVRVYAYAFSYPFLLFGLYFLTFTSSILWTYFPALGEQLIQIFSEKETREDMMGALLARFGIDCLLNCSNTMLDYCKSQLEIKLEKKMQEEFYKSLLDKDMSYYDNKKVGDLTSKFSSDLEKSKQLILNDITGTLSKIVTMASSFIFMLNLSPFTALYSYSVYGSKIRLNVELQGLFYGDT